MRSPNWMADIIAAGAMVAGVVFLVVAAISLIFIFGRSGNWLDAVIFGGMPLAGVAVIVYVLRKLNFFR